MRLPTLVPCLALVTAACGTEGSVLSDARPLADAYDGEARPITNPDEQVLVAGLAHQVTWEPGTGTVDVFLVSSNGTAHLLAEAQPDTGEADVTVPLLLGAQRDGTYLVVTTHGAAPVVDGRSVPCWVGAIATFAWNGSEEEYRWIDPVTGASETLAPIPQFASWSWKGGAATDPTLGVVYVQVNTGNGDEQAIHTVESRTGEVLASAILADPMTLLTGAVDRDGHVLGFGYDASAGGEQVYRIDPSTGARTTLGAPILDFDSWSGSSSLDVERDRLYAVHTAAASGVVVRTIDAATGADLGGEVVTLDGSPALSLDGLQVNPAGELLGIVQGGSIIADAGLHLVKVEPSTGVATLLGSIDDVLGWSGDTVYNPTTDVFVVFGLALDSAMHLWMLDGATGAVVHDTPLATAASSTLLVY